MSSTRTARFLATSALALVGAAGMGGAASATAAFTTVAGNPSCADLAPSGETWTEHKIDQDPAPGAYSPDGFSVTIAKAADGSLGWTSQADVVAVIVKGGDNANVYGYPGADDRSDSGLRTPVNPNGNPANGTKYYGYSHVSFCVGPAPAPASNPGTPTPAVTPTPQTPAPAPAPAAAPAAQPEIQAASQSEAPAAVAAAVEETPTQVLGVVFEKPAEPAAAAQLAATGMETSTLAAIAVGLVLLGGIALALGGRSSSFED
jgi:LPXTG-motif cell wall-anchored protein